MAESGREPVIQTTVGSHSLCHSHPLPPNVLRHFASNPTQPTQVQNSPTYSLLPPRCSLVFGKSADFPSHLPVLITSSAISFLLVALHQ